MASSQAPSSAQSPQIFIQPGSSSSSSVPRTSIVSLHGGKELLHVKPRYLFFALVISKSNTSFLTTHLFYEHPPVVTEDFYTFHHFFALKNEGSR